MPEGSLVRLVHLVHRVHRVRLVLAGQCTHDLRRVAEERTRRDLAVVRLVVACHASVGRRTVVADRRWDRSLGNNARVSQVS